MRRLRRAVKGRYGITAANLAVRTHVAWYWRVLQLLLIFAVGYAVAYWQFAARYDFPFDRAAAQKVLDVRALQEKVVQLESQLQVASAAQGNLAKEMAAMQDEGMRLKEDVAFYKSILAEGGTAGVPKIHSVKLSHGARPGEYQYHILLVQSGRHDKVVQGALQLVLNGTQGGMPLAQHVEPAGGQKGIKVNFKYYQRVEGVFSVPAQAEVASLQVQYVALGGKAPALSQSVSLPPQDIAVKFPQEG